MKKIIFSLLLLIIAAMTFAQSDFYYIHGKVVNKFTQQPLPFASVFAQNTTIGTVTDSAGRFTLRLPNGGYDLIVTFTGYETQNRRITTADATENIVIETRIAEKAMEEVSIVGGALTDGWEKYGAFFLENFIGKTKFGKECTIQNYQALKFTFSKKRNRLKVRCAEPLEIQNNALGYKIKYTLDSFIHEYNTQVSVYSGYPLFEEMQPTMGGQKEMWQANRTEAYNGSMLHFMKSIYTQTLKENNFEIQYLIKSDTGEAAFPLKNYYTGINYVKYDSTQTVEFTLNRPDLAVLYNTEKPSANYLVQSGDVNKDFELSILNIAPQKSIVIEQNGYYYDQNDLTISGYWTWEKVGDVLPYDFKP